ncbi:GerAB/ArcD/ProY family transporter [Mesobacillus jeotgali]|uniref:GerAB/ArcD/ProY family transporter n=1 Tax=Mesobacillus jeotgali TaxID=129985 RepID=UPI001592231E|nr:endospore germination permease [Mesobacillus jeotgali]
MKFSRLQISSMIILFTGISNHVMILPHLLSVAKRDAWVSIAISYSILLLWGIFVIFLLKRMNGEYFFSWVQSRGGAFAVRGFTLIFALYFLVSGILSSYDFILMIKIYFLPNTPAWIVTFSFIFLCVWAAYKEFRTILYASVLLLPIVWAFGYFVAFSTFNKKDYSNLFPVLVNGLHPVLEGVVIVLGGSMDLLIIFLIQDKLSKQFRFRHLVVLFSVVIMLVAGPTTGSIASFGPHVAANFRFPAFEQWRLVQLGRQVSHMDFLAVFQFLSGSFIKVSLSLFLLIDLFGIKSEVLKRNLLIAAGGIFSLASIVPLSDLLLQKMVGSFYYPVMFISGLATSAILLIIGILPKSKGVNNNGT